MGRVRTRFVVLVTAGALALVAAACFPPPRTTPPTTTSSTSVPTTPPIEVTDTGDGGDGTCDATCTLRDAIVAAESTPGASAIELPAGRFVVGSPPAGARGRSVVRASAIGADGEAFAITEPLVLTGVGAGATIIDFSGDAFRVGWLTSADLTIEDLAVTGLSITGGPAERTVVEGAFTTTGGLVRFARTAISDVAPDSSVEEPAAGSLVDVARDDPGSPFAVEVVDTTVRDLGRFQVQADETTDGMFATLVRNAGGTLLADGLDLSDASPLRLGRCATSLPVVFAPSLTAAELCPTSAVVWNSRLVNTAGPAIRPPSGGAPDDLVSSCQRDVIVAVDAKLRVGFTHVDPGPVTPACGSLPVRPANIFPVGETTGVTVAGSVDLLVTDSEITAPSAGGTSGVPLYFTPRQVASPVGRIRIERSTMSGGFVGLLLGPALLSLEVLESTIDGSYASVMVPYLVTGTIAHATLSGPYHVYTAPPEGVDPGPGLWIRASILQDCTQTTPMVVTSGGENVVGNCPSWPRSFDGDVVGVDPELGPLADNGGPTRTYLPSATSPALQKHWCTGTDQRGAVRPAVDGVDCDAGAVERNGTPGPLTGAPPFSSASPAPAVEPREPPVTPTTTSSSTSWVTPTTVQPPPPTTGPPTTCCSPTTFFPSTTAPVTPTTVQPTTTLPSTTTSSIEVA